METVTYNLEAFQGPLDLLLKLIEKNEIDIYDIPIAQLTDQYIETIKALPADMESMSEFLLMAATLLEIKSKMLLPKTDAPTEEEDPREALAARLAEYKRFKEITELLRQKNGTSSALFFKSPDEALLTMSPRPRAEDVLDGVTLERLYSLFVDVLSRREMKTDKIRAGFNSIQRDLFTVEEKTEYIMNLLFINKSVNFTSVFSECGSRSEKVVTFLALLELIMRKKITARQDGNFHDIHILPSPHKTDTR